MLAPSVSTRVGGVLDAALAKHIANVSTVGGVDFRRDIHHVRYCQVDADTPTPRFLLLLAGDISPTVLEAVAARPNEKWDREQIGDSPVVSHGAFWAAYRGAAGQGGELLLANDHDLVQRALTNSPGSYPLEVSMPFSAVISGRAFSRVKRQTAAGQLSVLDAVQELRLSVPPDGRSLGVRVIVANREAAEPLSQAIGPVLSAISKKLSRPGDPERKVVAENSGGDVVARMDLPDGTLDALVAGLSARAIHQ